MRKQIAQLRISRSIISLHVCLAARDSAMAKSGSDGRERLRLSADVLTRLRDRLDAAAGTAPESDKRYDTRLPYRISEVLVELRGAHAPLRRYAAPTRNISAYGIAFIIGHYV